MVRDIDRRAFLRRSAAASFGFAGATATATAQDDDSGGSRVTRRMAFEEPESLSDDYVRRIILLTDRHQESPDMAEVAECAFDDWPPDELTLWEGLIIEWRNRGFGELLTGDSDVRAEQMVETRIVVDEREERIELGTPFIVENRVECPDAFVGVTTSRIPGIRIRTPPSVDTDG